MCALIISGDVLELIVCNEQHQCAVGMTHGSRSVKQSCSCWFQLHNSHMTHRAQMTRYYTIFNITADSSPSQKFVRPCNCARLIIVMSLSDTEHQFCGAFSTLLRKWTFPFDNNMFSQQFFVFLNSSCFPSSAECGLFMVFEKDGSFLCGNFCHACQNHNRCATRRPLLLLIRDWRMSLRPTEKLALVAACDSLGSSLLEYSA